MANHPSAIKRARQNEKRRMRNKHVVSTCRTVIKKVRQAIAAHDAAGATQALGQAVTLLQRAASKGIIHKNQVSRKVGRLTKAVNGLAG